MVTGKTAEEVEAIGNMETDVESAESKIECISRDKLHLPQDSTVEKGAKMLLKECIPDLLRTTTASSASTTTGKTGQLTHDTMQLWEACFLYIAKKVSLKELKVKNKTLRSDSTVERSFTVTQLLRACNISFVGFAKELRHVIARLKPKLRALCVESSDEKETIETLLEMDELSMNFCHTSALFIKYKAKFKHLFKARAVSASANLQQNEEKETAEGCDWEEDDWFKLGWLLYIVCKSNLLPRYPDLVSCASILVCILNFLLAHLPPNRLKKPLNDPVAYPVRTQTGATYTLGCVAFLMHAHLQDVQKLMPKVDSFLMELLCKDPLIERCEPVVDAVIMTGCGNYKGLLAVGAAQRQLEMVEKSYEGFYRLNGEIDERDFAQLSSNKAMGNSKSITPRLNKQAPLSPPRDVQSSIKAPWVSPFRSNTPMFASPVLMGKTTPSTPISEAMAATQWLRKAVSNHINGTSPELERIFSSLDKDVKAQIETYVQELADKILPSVPSPKRGVSGSFVSEAVKRKGEGIALYYHILEAMLLAEEKRNRSSVIPALLVNKEIHASLVAFAFEVLADCYKITVLAFPTVLKRLNICAFDMCKVIEPLVRSEVNLNLPKEIKRHLYAIEEMSLESLSWKPGSSFYKYMIEARGKPAVQDKVGSSAFQPVNALPNTFGKADNATNSSSPAEKLLVEFFKKVSKLCTFRLIDLCNRLERDCMFKRKDCELVDAALVLEHVIRIVEYVIYDQTRLLYNRHIDQIILASLYGVCKVHQLGVTFRDIVLQYSKQAQCKQEVYRAVVLQQTYPELQVEETGDIILFYNRVVVPVIQNELLNLLQIESVTQKMDGRQEEKSPPTTPTKSQQSKQLPASVYPMRKIADNVFATQLPEHKKQEYLLASPSSHSLFTFIGESTHAYQSPSKRLDMINTKLNQIQESTLASQASVAESHQSEGVYATKTQNGYQKTKRMRVTASSNK